MTDLPPPPPPGPPPSWPPSPPPGAPPTFSPAPPPPASRRAVFLGVAALVLVGAAIVLVVVLVGRNSTPAGSNGESQKTAHQILLDSSTAIDSAASVHLTGQGKIPGETDVYDLHVGSLGTDGTITANGAVADIVVLGNDAYMRGRAFFGKFAGPAAGDAIGDRWVHVKVDDPQFGKFFQFLSFSGLRQVVDTVAQKSSVAKGSTTHVEGALVMQLRAIDGEVDIALDGRPYPMRLQFTDAGRSADLHFSAYDAPVGPPTRPTDVLELPAAPSA
jgi:hypothetical protein